MRAMGRPQQPRLRLFGGAHGGGDVGLEAVEAGQGHGTGRHGTGILGTLGWLGRKSHLQGQKWWGFLGWWLGGVDGGLGEININYTMVISWLVWVWAIFVEKVLILVLLNIQTHRSEICQCV